MSGCPGLTLQVLDVTQELFHIAWMRYSRIDVERFSISHKELVPTHTMYNTISIPGTTLYSLRLGEPASNV